MTARLPPVRVDVRSLVGALLNRAPVSFSSVPRAFSGSGRWGRSTATELGATEAFGAGTVALWGIDWRAGLAGVFASLLCLEALGGETGERRG